MFDQGPRGGRDGRGGRPQHQEEWGHKFWSWVSDLEDPDAPTMLNRGGDIAQTGVSFNFNYKPEENELTVNLQVGDKGDSAEQSLRTARHDVEETIAGPWEWDDPSYNDGHGCTYLFGRVEKDWDVRR